MDNKNNPGVNICTWHDASKNGAFQKLVEIDGNPVLFSDLLTVKPTFSFEFISFNYIEQANRFDRTIEVTTNVGDTTYTNIETVTLTDEEKAEVLNSINNITPPFEFYMNYRKNSIVTAYAKAVAELAGQCDQFETASWEVQKSEALAWNSDNTVPTPFLDQLLTARNKDKAEDQKETKDSLVSKIISKVAAYNTAYAEILGTYQSNLKRLSTITTIDDLLKFVAQ
jgi:hypothetical protein